MNSNQAEATKADILIADDHPENLRQLSSTLTERGYKVRRVQSGQQALDACQAAPPALILLDIRMRDISGYEICQRLKACEPTRDIPVIFVSALDAAFDKVRAFAAGCADYITKPVQVQEVLVRIEHQLKICNLQKQLSEQNARLQQEIIERKRTEAALRREEEKFAKAFHCSPNLIALNRLSDGRYLEVNDSFLSTFGYTRTQVIGSAPSQLNLLVNPEDCPNSDRQLLEFGRIRNQEIRLRTSSGEVRTVLCSAELIEVGGENCVLFVSNDITHRVRAEEALRESEAKNRALLNAIPDLIFCISRDGTFLNFKAAEAKDLCDPSTLFTGRKISELMPAPIAQQFLESAARTLETGDTQSFDYQLSIGDFLCSYEARLAVSGSQEVIVLVRDITERLRTEERLRLLERAIDASSNGIVITDATQPENPIIYVNKGFERIAGYAAEEVTGQNCRFLQSEDSNQPGFQEMRQAIQEQRECSVKLRNYRKDGTLFWNQLSISPIRDASGNVTQFVGVQTDITDRMRVEAELQQSQSHLAGVLNSSLDGVMAFSAVRNSCGNIIDFQWLLVNRAAEKIVGRTADDLVGKYLLQEMPGNGETGLFDLYVQVVETGVPQEREFYYEREGIKARFQNVSVKLGDGFAVTFRDITQRATAEEERNQLIATVRESQERLQMALEAARMGTWEWNILTGSLTWSDSLKRLFGHDPAKKEYFQPTYEAFAASLHPEDREFVFQSVNRALTEGAPYDIEFRIVLPDANIRWAGSKGQVFCDATGTPVRMAGVDQDITQRKQTEIALRESEERFRQIAENIHQLFWMTDPEKSQMIYVSPAYETIWGQTVAELYARPTSFIDAIHPDDRQRIIAAFAKQVRGEYDEEYRIVRPDGEMRWIRDRAFPIHNERDEVYRVVGIAEDITHRVQAEMALRESEERFRQIAENVREVFFIISPKADRMLYISPTYESIWGRSCASLYQHPQSWVESIHPADLPKTIAAFQTQLQTAEEFSQEYRIIRPDGDIRWIWARSFPICDETGRVYRLVGIAEDITSRVLAEQTLQQQKELLQTIFDHIPVMVTFYSPEGEMLLLNREVERVLGWSQASLGECDLLSECYPDPEDRQQVLDFILAATGEWRDMKTQARSGRIVDTSWANIRLSDGSRIGIGQDITARKQAERALRENEARFQKLAANIPGAIYEFVRHADGSFSFEYMSSACREILELPAERIIENAALVFEDIHPDDRQAVYQGTEISTQTLEPFACEWRTLTPSGKLKWVQAKSRPERRDSGEIVWYGVLFDISDRKRAEIEVAAAKAALEGVLQRMLLLKQLTEQIRQSLEFEQIIETAATQIGQAFGVNRCLIHTYILEPAQQIPIVAEYLTPGWNSMRDMAIPVAGNPHAELTIAQDKAVVSPNVYSDPLLKATEYLCHQFGLKSMAVVRTSYQGEPNGVIGLQQCDRFRHWSEEEIELLEAVAAQLGIAIAQARLLEQEKQQRQELTLKNSALEQARREAEAANIAKSRFLSHMSHELRTPLNAILGFSQVICRDSSLSPQHQEHLRIISRSGEHLLSLINDVLEMSKIEAGRLELCESDFDLFDLLDTLEQMFKLKANSKGLALTFDRAPDVPQYVLSDESKLRQVLINLLGNAIKFTQKGSVTLRVRLGHGAWGIAHRASGSEQDSQSPILNPKSPMPSAQCPIIFEVSDTGPGIAPEEMDSLFEAFGQTEVGRNSHEGTGLGLPISRQFVRLMGGDITLSSAPGRGTAFTFDVRVGLAEVAQVETRQPARRAIGLAPGQPPCRILVVEDRAENRQLLVELLESLGFEVRSAVNGQEAIALWSTWQPHLIWMDMRMPVMDGHEATKQIKATRQGEDTVIIALTASAFEEERAIILQAGCDDFLRKPFREEVLLAKIAEHLEVEYVYEEDQPKSPQPAAVPWELTPQDLAVMPAQWVAQLRHAALSADDELILELLEEIPRENATLARALADLVSNFRFDRLAGLTEPAF
ncbi:PAS domain S-box protein [Kamptonema formosum]|uniref:PAS domain S-box protein n=1 Tax=Kamptonema formosum TaxID=331992 RepID=UPI00034A08DE|nr:PAS domain S-box protein [Oscillatoria sp. PCC 10802]